MMNFSILQTLVLAQQTQPEAGGFTSLLVPLMLFAGMWFLLIAPQRKKQKQHTKMLQSLQSGDDVVVAGGIYGTITNVKDDRFVVRIAEGTKVEVTKASVQAKVDSSKASTQKAAQPVNA